MGAQIDPFEIRTCDTINAMIERLNEMLDLELSDDERCDFYGDLLNVVRKYAE